SLLLPYRPSYFVQQLYPQISAFIDFSISGEYFKQPSSLKWRLFSRKVEIREVEKSTKGPCKTTGGARAIMLSTGVNIIPQTGFSEIFFVDDFGSSTKRKSIKLVDSNDIVKVREILKDGQIGNSVGSLFPQKININEDEGVHDFLIDDLRNINCAAREVLDFESRDREEVERRRTLKAIEEMRRASEEQICIEKCATVFIEASCNSSQYGTTT
ncbi:hypothetical protein PV326_010076, partial [Microctonus aethiopoides]